MRKTSGSFQGKFSKKSSYPTHAENILEREREKKKKNVSIFERVRTQSKKIRDEKIKHRRLQRGAIEEDAPQRRRRGCAESLFVIAVSVRDEAVPVEGAAGCECLGTGRALERLLASVRSRVADQVSLLCKGRLADVTPVRSLSGVGTHVLDQVSFLGEAALAHLARVRSLARVRARVLGEMAPLLERRTAVNTVEAAGTVARAPVRQQGLAAHEHLATQLAPEAFPDVESRWAGGRHHRHRRGSHLRHRLRGPHEGRIDRRGHDLAVGIA